MEFIKNLFSFKKLRFDAPHVHSCTCSCHSQVTNPLDFDGLSALQIPEIVCEILSYMDPKELPKCRLVCKTWSEVGIKGMKKRSIFLFNTHYKMSRFLTTDHPFDGFRNLKLKFTEENTMDSGLLLYEFLSIHGKTVRNFELDFKMDDQSQSGILPLTREEFRDVCLATLGQLNSLTLKNLPCVFTHSPIFPEDDVTDFLMQNLTTMSVHFDNRFECFSTENQSDDFFSQLIRIAPNLEILKVSKTCKDIPEEGTVGIIQALLDINPPLPLFKELHVYAQFPRELVESLVNSGKRLERIFIQDFEGFVVDIVKDEIQIRARQGRYSGIPARVMMNYIQRELIMKCGVGVTCVELLKEFLDAFQRRVGGGVGVDDVDV